MAEVQWFGPVLQFEKKKIGDILELLHKSIAGNYCP